MTKICGAKTIAGHGCMNPVSDDGDHCAAGHLCVPNDAGDDTLIAWRSIPGLGDLGGVAPGASHPLR